MNPQRQGAFRRYSSLARSEFKYSGFYYIGRTAAHIEKLVKMYERGYSSDTPDIARKELIRSLEQEQNNLPEVIICEAGFPVTSIRQFNQFLRQHPVFSLIPLVLNTGNLSPEELEKAGVSVDTVRLSIGIEHVDDLIADLEQALATA